MFIITLIAGILLQNFKGRGLFRVRLRHVLLPYSSSEIVFLENKKDAFRRPFKWLPE